MNIKYNSKKIEKGDTFIALRTNNDGHKYIEDAIKNGATKVIAEYGNYPVETIIVNNTKDYLVKYLYDNYYSEIKDLKLIGITGTNGKTTTSILIHNMLNKLGKKTAYIGTNGFYIGKFIKELPNTTPEIIDIYELLIEAKKEGCEYVCLEASSHGLDQNRLKGLKFDFAVFTNLTHEHLGYHKTMENYAKAKQKLFNMLRNNKYAIINNDDNYKDYFIVKGNNNITYSFTKGDYYIKEYNITLSHSTFSVMHNNENYTFSTKMLGKHNIYNSLVSIIILNKIGYTFEEINKVLNTVEGPIGRMENINYKNNNIIIDYAHTPDGIENVLKTARELKPNKIITVIGCGGGTGSDREKRSEMGNLVLAMSNKTIFTNDNPRDEDPNQIINDLIKEKVNNNYIIELDRKTAIKKGIEELTNNDILLILGKGHENYQIIGSNKTHFSDKEAVQEIIKKI
ncbi:MAG: UDP-N-acetylmuramoyl-L-alanyl-D-glutamate--2,6-diaminopimelate ligase [Bacilli bacterium]